MTRCCIALALLYFTSLIVGYQAHSWIVESINKTHTKDIKDAVNEQKNICAAAKRITEEVSNDYQKSLSDLNGRVAARKLQPQNCIAVLSGAASGHPAATGTNADGSAHGINVADLREFAADAERYRLRLIACQAFINKTWEKEAR